MPEMKHTVYVRAEGKKIVRQKWLILGNLEDIYRIFKGVHPTIKIAFSEFADLRPKYCVLAGANGTHTVSVCTIHQNVKLMIKVADSTVFKDKTYKDFLATLSYNPGVECFLGECRQCPDPNTFREILVEVFEKEAVDLVTYKQWVTTD